ncbi:SRPBCC family protein [Mycolicibacterium mengxianglii]|uniref:hypothetical protein n=1 Tax=Mycolicibacterium mengxianglii TaxID=2736649 RepID=UPI0018D05923|nr:hypothetical protein [Mycolicibacterium mengxianglii]
MNVINAAKEQAKGIAAKVLHATEREPRSQSITIRQSREAVTDLFQDAERLSQVFGDIAEVEHLGPRRLRWKFAGPDGDTTKWECVVTVQGDSLRFDDVRPDSTHQIALDLRQAPQDHGTEVIARVSSPAPGLLTGPLIFKALYRARALLQTGEIPTITPNPSARKSDR